MWPWRPAAAGHQSAARNGGGEEAIGSVAAACQAAAAVAAGPAAAAMAAAAKIDEGDVFQYCVRRPGQPDVAIRALAGGPARAPSDIDPGGHGGRRLLAAAAA